MTCALQRHADRRDETSAICRPTIQYTYCALNDTRTTALLPLHDNASCRLRHCLLPAAAALSHSPTPSYITRTIRRYLYRYPDRRRFFPRVSSFVSRRVCTRTRRVQRRRPTDLMDVRSLAFPQYFAADALCALRRNSDAPSARTTVLTNGLVLLQSQRRDALDVLTTDLRSHKSAPAFHRQSSSSLNATGLYGTPEVT